MYSLDENLNLVSCSLANNQSGVDPLTNDDDWVLVDYANIDDNSVHTLKTIHNLLTVSNQMQKSLFTSPSKTAIKDLYSTK